MTSYQKEVQGHLNKYVKAGVVTQAEADELLKQVPAKR